jgi:hypothetical protein
MKAHLDQLEREVLRIVGAIRALETISVPSASRLLGKPKKWLRSHLPIVIYGAKSHHIRVADIAAWQAKRTVWPVKNGNGDAQ